MTDNHSINARFFLDFLSDNTGRIEICEPIGFDASNLTLEQENGRLGRDVSFAGGDIDLEFEALIEIGGLTHQFDNLIRYYNTFGFESNVRFIINTNNVDKIIGELDYKQSETDIIKTFKCKIIQDSLQARVKRRSDVNVDLFSDTDVDGNPIEPLATESILLKAAPLMQSSEWSSPEEPTSFTSDGNDPTRVIGFSTNIINSEIGGTLSPFFGYEEDNNFAEQCVYITATENLSNIRVDIPEFDLRINDVNSNGNARLFYRVGSDFNTATDNLISVLPINTDIDTNFSFDINNINRDESLWIYIFVTNLDDFSFVDINRTNVIITATETSVDSITQSVRLVDVMQQVVRSISGADIIAPEFRGQFLNQFLFTGSLIRGIQDREFNISLDDILDGIKEFNGDYEVTPDGRVFFGIYDEFYTDNSLATFKQPAHLEFTSSFNERYEINQINYEYENYEEGNNDAINQSYEGVHTECQMLLPNEMVQNNKEVNNPWGRDPFWIEKIRRQGIEVSEDVSQEQDNDIAIISIIESDGVINRQEGFLLRHSISNISVLTLNNDGSFSFDLLGISVNDTITLTGENAGSYIVGSFTAGSISLLPVAPTPNPTFEGQSFTEISYNVTSTNLITETNELFDFIEGSTAPEGFANMRFTPKRNIINFYGSYLATASFYKQGGTITNTKFIHNGDFTTSLSSEDFNIREDQDLEVDSLPAPILKPIKVTSEVFTDFDTVWALMNNLRSVRGYISLINTNDTETKVHPTSLVFDWARQVLQIDGEVRI